MYQTDKIPQIRKRGSFFRSALAVLGLVTVTGGAYVAGRLHDDSVAQIPRAVVQQHERTYDVQPSDTLGQIAVKHNVSLDELVSLNGIADPDTIRVGYELKLPDTQTDPRVKTKDKFPLDYKSTERAVASFLPKGATLSDSWVEGDLDRDGKKDLIVSISKDIGIGVHGHRYNSNILLLSQDGKCIQTKKFEYQQVLNFSLHDLDNDTIKEILAELISASGGNHGDNFFSIYKVKMGLRPIFEWHGYEGSNINISDFDNDKQQEILAIRYEVGPGDCMADPTIRKPEFYAYNGSQFVRSNRLEKKIRDVHDKLELITHDPGYSIEEKRSRMHAVQKTYGEALTMVAIRMFPVVDPADGRLKPFDNWMREFVDKNTDEAFRGTPMGRDPVGVSFDLLVGRYRPDDFVREHFGDFGGSAGGRICVSDRTEVIERYPGPSGGGWSKVRTPAGDYLYRDPEGGLHHTMGGRPIDTTPQVTYRGYSNGKEWLTYKDPITGDTWRESRPETSSSTNQDSRQSVHSYRLENSRTGEVTRFRGTESEAWEKQQELRGQETRRQTDEAVGNIGREANRAAENISKGIGDGMNSIFGGQKKEGR